MQELIALEYKTELAKLSILFPFTVSCFIKCTEKLSPNFIKTQVTIFMAFNFQCKFINKLPRLVRHRAGA
jgi:hypothetical protein